MAVPEAINDFLGLFSEEDELSKEECSKDSLEEALLSEQGSTRSGRTPSTKASRSASRSSQSRCSQSTTVSSRWERVEQPPRTTSESVPTAFRIMKARSKSAASRVQKRSTTIGDSSPKSTTGRRRSTISSPKRSISAPRASSLRSSISGPCTGLWQPPSPPSRQKGDVWVCARLRPGPRPEMSTFVETSNCVRLRSSCALRRETRERGEDIYWCDHAFGPEASQETVYNDAVLPICESVLEGYNGAVIAYGQTGSGKTYTVIGDPHNRGIIPRAVSSMFDGLQSRKHWTVEICVLEIYNERTRDLLAPHPGVTQVDIHENLDPKGGIGSFLPMFSCPDVPSFTCPDATRKIVHNPEEALKALFESLRKRETARTDMNHHSSRSHLIYSMTIIQSDDALKATLKGKLHLVDLAGCERLKRSMCTSVVDDKMPRDRDTQRREAGAINKSLTQLALVIHRLTTQTLNTNSFHVPYRDSMLTRLLADSFGGSSKTCVIITCSPLFKDREETKCALEFGKRANLVKNVAEINIEMQQEPSDVVKALVAKELGDLKRERENLQNRLREAALEAVTQNQKRVQDVQALDKENGELRAQFEQAALTSANAQKVAQAEIMRIQRSNADLREWVEKLLEEASRAQIAKAALQNTLLSVLQQGMKEDDAIPSQVEAANDFLQNPEEAPGENRLSILVDCPVDIQSVETDCQRIGREALRRERLSTLEEESKSINARWKDVLCAREGKKTTYNSPRSVSEENASARDEVLLPGLHCLEYDLPSCGGQEIMSQSVGTDACVL